MQEAILLWQENDKTEYTFMIKYPNKVAMWKKNAFIKFLFQNSA